MEPSSTMREDGQLPRAVCQPSRRRPDDRVSRCRVARPPPFRPPLLHACFSLATQGIFRNAGADMDQSRCRCETVHRFITCCAGMSVHDATLRHLQRMMASTPSNTGFDSHPQFSGNRYEGSTPSTPLNLITLPTIACRI